MGYHKLAHAICYLNRKIKNLSLNHLIIDESGDELNLAQVAISGNYNDLSNKPTKLSLFVNDPGYITNPGVTSVNNKTGNVTIQENVLSDWNAKSGLAAIKNKPTLFDGNYNSLSNKPTLFDGDYNSLSNKPTLFDGNYNSLSNKPTIPTVPTNVSAFNNDAGYLTQHQSLNGYATESYVNSKITDLIGAAPEEYDTLKEIANKLSDNDDAVSAITTTLASKANSADVYTKTESDTKYQEKGNYLTEHQSLSNYIQKSETVGLIKNDGTIDTNTYLTEHQPLNGYATEEWVNQQGYLTSHQDISSKADKTATVSNVSYNTSEKKIEKTINGTTTNIVTAAKIVQDGGGITVETDPTVPEWAKQLTKPSYTAQEVGALPDDTLIPDPQIQSDWGQNDSTKKDYIKNKPTIPTIPTNISAFNNDSGYLTEQYILDDLAAVAVSGDYADLKNTPEIPTIPTRVGAFTNDVGYLTQHQSLTGYATESWVNQQGFITSSQQQDISGKYDKAGGNISGDVDIDGDLTLNIEDEDYDSGITMSAALNDNLGTILTLNGYANANGNNTNYKPVLRNVATPNSNYDAANKKYVDDNLVIPTYHLVELNPDWSVKLQASSLTYSSVSSNFTNPREEDYLDIIKETSSGSNVFIRFHVPCLGIDEVNNGNLLFGTNLYVDNNLLNLTFSLSNQDVLTTLAVVQTPESAVNKVNSVVSYSTSTLNYPSTKAVFDEFQRKPVTVWETSGTGLFAVNSDISASPSWQLTNLDFSPYKRVKIYTKCAQKSSLTPSASTTSAMILEMSLDSRAGGPYNGHFVGSIVSQNPNDANRLSTLTCAISGDKTSFIVLRMTTLYGTAATNNTDANGYVFKIEGYYD